MDLQWKMLSSLKNSYSLNMLAFQRKWTGKEKVAIPILLKCMQLVVFTKSHFIHEC